jgi:AraC-like DNA-binding protein
MWQTIRSSVFGRHNHEHAYAAIVLSGEYEEAGDHGRFRVEAGDVILHERFEAHINRFAGSGAIVLNLPLPHRCLFQPGRASIADADSIVRIAEKDRAEATGILLSGLTARAMEYADWPDELAAALMGNTSLSLSRWAETKGLTPWAVSRGFLQMFGLSPSAFRARIRARLAWKAIETSEMPLVEIAAHFGFADQPHMTRSVKQLTGVGPMACRAAANRFKTRRR